jgi:hypothetical protein
VRTGTHPLVRSALVMDFRFAVPGAWTHEWILKTAVSVGFTAPQVTSVWMDDVRGLRVLRGLATAMDASRMVARLTCEAVFCTAGNVDVRARCFRVSSVAWVHASVRVG